MTKRCFKCGNSSHITRDCKQTQFKFSNVNIELDDNKRCLRGISGSVHNTLGSFTIPVHVDDLKFDVIFHVVRERDMDYAAIIGNIILKQVDLIVSEDLVECKQKNRINENTLKKTIRLRL